jgi:RimJ/RimL family protein N-acetyltransferase
MLGGRTARCRRGRHQLETERLRICHPTENDVLIARAAGSDDNAARWMGWTSELVIHADHRAAFLAQRPGRGRPWRNHANTWVLVAIDRDEGRIAGAIQFYEELQEIGGWLAPAFRGRGLGRELFGGAATFVHHHLGIATVRAGADPANTASVGALVAAGFEATEGLTDYRLPNGHVVPARWFRHVTDRPATCR